MQIIGRAWYWIGSRVSQKVSMCSFQSDEASPVLRYWHGYWHGYWRLCIVYHWKPQFNSPKQSAVTFQCNFWHLENNLSFLKISKLSKKWFFENAKSLEIHEKSWKVSSIENQEKSWNVTSVKLCITKLNNIYGETWQCGFWNFTGSI